jgi:cell division protein FtsQ
MGRKLSAQLGVESPEEYPVEPDPGPEPQLPPVTPRRARAKASEVRSGWRSKTKRTLIVAAIVLGAFAIAAAAYQVDEFLASDPHFLLPADAKGLSVQGVVYAPRADVARVFARDFGRSVYLIPLAERRSRLLGIDWVADATVSRHWPNRIAVQIVERKPIAFVVLPAQAGWAGSEVALVDAEGVILAPPARAHFSLPALAGISRREPAATRRTRVRGAAELIAQVRTYAAQISEIDVSDPDDLVVTLAQGRALRLRLGNRNYFARLSNFLTHYPDISRRLPYARTFDLRLDDHITAQDGGPDGR